MAPRTAVDGTAADGTAADGTAADGTAVDGTAVDGTAVDGTAVDGTVADDTTVDGTAVDGTAGTGPVVDVQALVNVREFETAARTRLDPVHYAYFAGGAQDEVTVGENESAFRRLALVPRVLRGAGTPRLAVTVLGRPAATPIMIAPTAFHRLAHPEAERATARAAGATGTIMISAMLSTVAIEDIAAEARAGWQAAARDGGPDPRSEPHPRSERDPRSEPAPLGGDGPDLWFQLYVQPDLTFTEAIVRRAEAAGCRALVVTTDSPALGRHERNDRNGFHDLPPGMRCENLREPRAGARPNGPMPVNRQRAGAEPGSVRQVVLSPEISWRHIDWLRGITDLPIVLKGVLHPRDARLAVERGVDGLVVSNHGGRQLDTTPATIAQLPVVAEAVEGRIPLLLDGGVRRGTDVVKALALGAAAVAIGRPVIWGLAAGGEAGVTRVLELLRVELANALALCGCASPGEIEREIVRIQGAS